MENKTLTVVVVVVGLIIISMYIYKFYQEYKQLKAVMFTSSNDLMCGTPKCPINLDSKVELPEKYDDKSNDKAQLDVAYYLVNAVANFIQNFSKDPLTSLKGEELLYLNEKDEPFGVVCSHTTIPNLAVIIFRGTQTLSDLVTDLQYTQVSYDSNKLVHKGFLDSYNKVKQNIAGSLGKIQPKTVIVTGHSLGGAVSILCGADLAQQGRDVLVHTFASPAVGNDKFDEYCLNLQSLRVLRTVNLCDIVPNQPPPVSPNFNDPTKPYFYKQSYDTLFITFSENRLSVLNNHFIANYLDNIKAIKGIMM